MEFKEEEKDGIVILILSGDIDLNHSPKLRKLLREKVGAETKSLLFDFSSVNYIDSSGLATLVEYYQGSRKYLGKIALASLNTRVKSVFELVRLGEIFPIYNSLEEAQDALSEE